ncbi:Lrp/AsnC family transcriptional regulator [Mycobacterium sp. DL99]|uniref:Lrp/AsnC family transcriptional regulator n=1 Tax=Mycobacterium sp. DL99 TaxID=2528957 RepID=UPI001082209C|nr:Lrp/AsnC family transcriptional regulator [Mycobacterium sp. DL99]
MQKPWLQLQSQVDLDPLDARLLTLLADDGRMTNASLAAYAGIPASTCLNRMRSLADRGVLVGQHSRISWEALGLKLDVLVGVTLRNKEPAAVGSTVTYIRQMCHVTAVLRTTGPFDLMVNAVVIDSDHLLTQVIDPLTQYQHIANTQTYLVSEHWQRASLLGDFFRM